MRYTVSGDDNGFEMLAYCANCVFKLLTERCVIWIGIIFVFLLFVHKALIAPKCEAAR